MTTRVINNAIKAALQNLDKPLAIILAGHNGSGKTTLWYKHIAQHLTIPLINADRMMLSILPEPNSRTRHLPAWAQNLRDNDKLWMSIAQRGVQAFVAQAMGSKAAFAMETVFSYWEEQANGTIKSKIDTIADLQGAGYFVLLMFVGLTSVSLSIGRVHTRTAEGGHDVDFQKLRSRFPRTQHAVNKALKVADATILFDNSRSQKSAFTPVHIRTKTGVMFDIRNTMRRKPRTITTWLDIVAPLSED
jgi:Uncharacterized protein conserved in bacteria